MKYFKKYFNEVENCYVREFGENFLIWENPNDIEKEIGIKKVQYKKQYQKIIISLLVISGGYKEMM